MVPWPRFARGLAARNREFLAPLDVSPETEEDSEMMSYPPELYRGQFRNRFWPRSPKGSEKSTTRALSEAAKSARSLVSNTISKAWARKNKHDKPEDSSSLSSGEFSQMGE